MTIAQTPMQKIQTTQGGEQARRLRALARQRSQSVDAVASRRCCHTIAIAGGKGGTGRSVVAINLAIELAKRGAAVGVLDASAEFGSIEFLCGLNGYWNLSHVANGSRALKEVIQQGPASVRILAGGASLILSGRESMGISSHVYDQLIKFERELDWVIIDASGAVGSLSHELAAEADDLLVVATPEPTSVAEAYATVKSFSGSRIPRLGLLVNQADSAGQAQKILDRLQQTAHSFLQLDLHRRGFIPRDPMVPQSVKLRVPFAVQFPESPASQSVRNLALRWTRDQSRQNSNYFARLRTRDDSNEKGRRT